jgi:hypothetical protein
MKRNGQAQEQKRLAQLGADDKGHGEYRQTPSAAEMPGFIGALAAGMIIR